MSHAMIAATAEALVALDAQGLMKRERVISSPQSAWIEVGGRRVLNLCANNYLGLADHPKLVAAAHAALDSHGLGMASVRFICGTSDLHRALERQMAEFLSTEDCILFPSCFDANAGIFEALLGAEDAIVSDSLNHASIIDGVRLCKARRLRFASGDMGELDQRLAEAADARHRLIVTDGVFSMDGIVADLPSICDLAERHDALVMVDDCHATGFIGANGAGTPEHHGVTGRVQILSGTFGKALGGASGGYVAGPGPLVEMLRQRARPYLFSNAIPPAMVAGALAALDLLAEDDAPRRRLAAHAARFREGMAAAGFTLAGAGHPIVPVMLFDAPLAQKFAAAMMEEGIYVTAFAYPVVPQNKARIRTQMSAALTDDDIDMAVAAFTRVGRKLGAI